MESLSQLKTPGLTPRPSAPTVAAPAAPHPAAAGPTDTVLRANPHPSIFDKLPLAERTFSGHLRRENFFEEDNTAIKLYGPENGAGTAPLQADRRFFSGTTGRYLAARFADPSARTDGDFRYACGKEEFRGWLKADEALQDIPQGQLADNLNVDLVNKLQNLSSVPDTHSLAGWATLAGEALFAGHPPSASSSSTRANVQTLLDKTRDGLKDPSSDPYQLAANFVSGFVSAHPFEANDGRVAMLLSDRILAERGLPAPIMAEANSALPSEPKQLAQSLREGVERARHFCETASQGNSNFLTVFSFRSGKAPAAIPAPKDLVRVNGMPYGLNSDGFVYDLAGRPYRADEHGQLQPMSELEHILEAHQIGLQPDPKAALESFTASTREAFAKLKDQGDKAVIGDDDQAMHADNKFAVSLQPGSHQDVVKLYDPKVIGADTLFQGQAMSAHSTLATTAMSRYDQLDLSMWHMQKAMEKVGDKDGAQAMLENRSNLFTMAKSFLRDHPSEKQQNVEKLKLESSPLRFDSLADASKHLDDDKITLWRGDLSVAELIGAQPDYIPGRNDAKDDGKLRDARGGTKNILDQLDALSGSAEGTGLMSFTSDPLLLADEPSFASKTTGTFFALKDLPGPLQSLVSSQLPAPGAFLEIDKVGQLAGTVLGAHRAVPKGMMDIGEDPSLDATLAKRVDQLKLDPATTQALKQRIADTRKQLEAPHGFLSHSVSSVIRVDDLVKDAAPMQRLQEALAPQRALLSIRRTDDGNVSLQLYRRVFVSEVNKADCIPGINALGGGAFENEQEVHVDHAQGPGTIVKQYPSCALTLDDDAPLSAYTIKQNHLLAEYKAKMAAEAAQQAAATPKPNGPTAASAPAAVQPPVAVLPTVPVSPAAIPQAPSASTVPPSPVTHAPTVGTGAAPSTHPEAPQYLVAGQHC